MSREAKGRRASHYLFISSFIVTIILAVAVATTGYTGTGDGSVEAGERESYVVYGVNIPERVSFAGEPVPLDLFDVKEALDRELLSNTYFHSQTIRLIKMANRYFPQIEPVLKKNLIPEDFKYLALAESGLTQAVSPAKAVGCWQLMKGTAQEYGLEVSSEVDERYHVAKSTEVACVKPLSASARYLKSSGIRFFFRTGSIREK